MALGVALAATAVSVALAYVPLPRARALFSHIAPTHWPNLGWLALGLTPLLAAYQLVELAALAVPRWRALRLGDDATRRPLRRASLLLALGLAALQAYSISVYIEARLYSLPGAATISFGWGPRLLDVGVLLSGLCLLIALAAMIRRWGLGEGYSWILLGSLVPALGPVLFGMGRAVGVGQRKPISVLAELLVVAALFVAARRALRHSAARADAEPLRPREPSAGVLAVSWPVDLLMLPATLGSLVGLDLGRIGLGRLISHITPGTPFHTGLWVALTAALSLSLSRAFYRPHNVARGLADVGAEGFDEASFSALRREATRRSTLLLCALPLVSYALARFVTSGSAGVSLIAVVVAAAIVEDIGDEWRGRRVLSGFEEPLLSLTRLYQIAPARARLRDVGIDCFVRGAQHRTLLSFFGPFIPLTIFVRADDVAQARQLLKAAPAPREDRR